jgi:hypothetical protein
MARTLDEMTPRDWMMVIGAVLHYRMRMEAPNQPSDDEMGSGSREVLFWSIMCAPASALIFCLFQGA